MKSKPDFIVMDTYSELVDKKFIYKSESFFCVAGDLRKSARSSLDNGELISLSCIEAQYLNYFKRLKQKYNCPIIVIIFPAYLDSRQKYQDRFQSLQRALENIEKNTNLIKLLQLDRNEYIGAGDFPYHFSSKTKNDLRVMMEKIIRE